MDMDGRPKCNVGYERQMAGRIRGRFRGGSNVLAARLVLGVAAVCTEKSWCLEGYTYMHVGLVHRLNET